MKLVRDTTGRFAERPHYEAAELDRECEKIICGFLKDRYGVADFPVSTDDLASLIEVEAQDLDLYADLSEFGANVEGVTIFVPGAKPKVRIAAALSEDPARENRLRTTLTHEYGHVHFHSYLFDQPARSIELFARTGPSGGPASGANVTQVCKRDTMLEASSSDWMEWQAGHVCGAILMPASRVRRLAREQFGENLVDGSVSSHTGQGGAIIEVIQGVFKVSRDAARVRLLRLGILSGAAAPQGRLAF
jgi:hypothetical protein